MQRSDEAAQEISMEEWGRNERGHGAEARRGNGRPSIGAARDDASRHAAIFHDSPIPIYEKNLSAAKPVIDELRRRGIRDFHNHLHGNIELIQRLANLNKIVWFSDATLELYRAPSKEAYWSRMDELFLSTERHKMFADIVAAFAEGESKCITEGWDQTYGGERIFVRETAVIARGGESDWSRILCTIEEITDRKHAEEKLIESERKYRSLVSNIPGAFYRTILDSFSITEYFSEKASEITGYPTSALTGRDALSWNQLILPEDRAKYRSPQSKSLPKGGPYSMEYRIRRKDGAIRWLVDRGTVFRGEDGMPYCEGVLFDITEKKKVVEALRRHEERYARALEAGRVGVWEWNFETDALYLSPNYVDIVGYPADKFKRIEDWDPIVHPDDRESYDRFLTHIAKDDAIEHELEYRIIHADGSIHWIFGRGTTVRDESGRLRGATGSNSDVTERKELYCALQAAMESTERAHAAKSRFFAAASHDIRQPLHAARLFAEALARTARTEKDGEIIGNLESSLEDMGELLDAVLDISTLDARTVRPDLYRIPLTFLFDRLTAEFLPQAMAKGLEFRAIPNAHTVLSDVALLGRILRNLISNAIRHTDTGGILLGARRRGDCLRLEVWDTGAGIPEDQLDRIFEEFYQLPMAGGATHQGLGLGLAIVRRLTDLLGHRLDVRSIPGRGSVFAVEVPLAREDSRVGNDVSPQPSASVDLQGKVVLFIEDDPHVRGATDLLLKDWGCTTIAARDIHEALRTLEQQKLTPEIVIADFRLPEGETGLNAIRRIEGTVGRRLPSIVITGASSPEIRREVEKAGRHFLRKPVRAAKLRALLHHLIEL
jgi:PAS domain S-box-containing protein